MNNKEMEELEKQMKQAGDGTLLDDSGQRPFSTKFKEDLILELVKGAFTLVGGGLALAGAVVTLAASKNDLCSASANLKAASIK